MNNLKIDSIAVVDFGSQYAHLIANRIRRLNVHSEIVLPETSLEEFKKFKGIILSGGPQSVYEKGAPTIDKRIFELGVPVLCICYGHQLAAYLLGGKVVAGKAKEYGLAELQIIEKSKKNCGIFSAFSQKTQVWMSHGDTVGALAPGFLKVGTTDDCEFAAAVNPEKKIYTTQFHLEVNHTPEGMKVLDAFIVQTGVARTWSMKQFLERKMSEVKEQIGSRSVFMLTSGGVDSTVAYVLLSKALGTKRVYGLFVDTGLLRKDEAKKTEKLLKRIGIKNFHVHNGRREFLKNLKGITDPEEKRAIIGKTFLDIQAAVTKKMKLNPKEWMLGQGTIYPDTIESKGTKHADKIKTHHNRVPEIMKMIEEGRVIEPIAELYKDEVRALGTEMGLPKEAVWKHPFPGPGLGVRILCSNGDDVLPNEYMVHEELINEYLEPLGLSGVIAPIRSVGVGGDSRSYKNPLIIWASGNKHSYNSNRSNKSQNISMEELEKLSTYITNHFPVVNRVCLLLAPHGIEQVAARSGYLSDARIAHTQKLDNIVMKFAEKNKIMDDVWQFPSVLVPLSINGVKKDAVVLRPICSDEAMTAHFYKMSYPRLSKLTKLLTSSVSGVLFDITNKPPGTIEWE